MSAKKSFENKWSRKTSNTLQPVLRKFRQLYREYSILKFKLAASTKMKAKLALMTLFALSAQCACAREVTVTLTSNWHYELNSTTQHEKKNWVNFIGDDDDNKNELGLTQTPSEQTDCAIPDADNPKACHA